MEFLLSFIVIVALLGWILSKLLPFILARWIRKRTEDVNSGFDRFYDNVASDQNEKASEGDVYVSQSKDFGKDKIMDETMGEYVDFEQVKEDKE